MSIKLKPIHILKREAKELKKERFISWNEALNITAKKYGFNSWSLLAKKHIDHLPNSLDEFIAYINPRDFTLVGGRPNMGKTFFTTNISKKYAELGFNVFYYAIEESSKSIASKLISPNPSKSLDSLPSEQLKEVGTSISKLAMLPIFISDAPNISVEKIEKDISTLSEINEGDIIIIDYIQLAQVESYNLFFERLKLLVDKYNLRVFILSQVDKGVDERSNKRPEIQDILSPLSVDDISAYFNKVVFLFKSQDDMKNSYKNNKIEFIIRKPKQHSFFIH